MNELKNKYLVYLCDGIYSVINGTLTSSRAGQRPSEEQISTMRDGIFPYKISKIEQYYSSLLIIWKPVDLLRCYSTTGFRYDGKWSFIHNITVGLFYGLSQSFAFCGRILLFKLLKGNFIKYYFKKFYYSKNTYQKYFSNV